MFAGTRSTSPVAIASASRSAIGVCIERDRHQRLLPDASNKRLRFYSTPSPYVDHNRIDVYTQVLI